MSMELISFLIHWGPTLIFLFFLLIAFLFGLMRGFRKSMILLIQAASLFTVLLIIYLIIVNQPSTDGWLFKTISGFVGEGEIQRLLGVSESNQTFVDCFIEFLPKQLPVNEGLALVLKDNGAYLATLADMLLRFVIAIIFYVIYLIGVFLLYIIYFIFYPQRRYERKLKREYLKNQQQEKVKLQALEEEKARKALEDSIVEDEEENLIIKDPDAEDDAIIQEAVADDTIEGEEISEIHEDSDDFDEFDEFLNSIPEKTEEDSNPEHQEVMEGEGTDAALVEEVNEEPKEEIHEEVIEEKHEQAQEEVTEKPEPYQPKYQGQFVYPKRRLFGALVGSLRNLVAALVFFSFLGGILFLFTGGSGEGSYEDYDFEDPQMNQMYDVYKEIETYGSTGIFKVLNLAKDQYQVPYYLFACDLVFQGGLHDEEREINQNVYLRRELASFTKFARQTLDLLLKYGKDEIKNVIHKNSETDQTFDLVMTVMSKEGFQEDFNVVIDEFEESTYFLNLSYSLISSVISHIDKLGLEDVMGSEPVALFQILFKKGYLATQIPYENKLLENNSNEVLAYISPDLIINKENAKVVTNMLFDFAKTASSEEVKAKEESKRISYYIESLLPHVTEFSFFKGEDSVELSNVLKRVYEFTLNTYVKGFVEGQGMTVEEVDPNVNPYTKDSYKDVNFAVEIKNTISVFGDLLQVYNNAMGDDGDFLNMIFNVFDESNPNHAQALAGFKNVKTKISESFLLGELLGSSYGKGMIESLFKSFSSTLTLPNINYRDKKDSNGNTIHGEFYCLLSALEAFCSDKKNKDIINNLSTSMDNPYDLIIDLCNSLESTDSSGKKVITYIVESLVFRAVFSNVLLNTNFGDFSIYVDESLTEMKDSTKLIKSQDLEDFFTSAKGIVSIFKDVADKPASEMMKAVISDTVYNALNSKIIEGTVTKYIASNINIDMVVIPNEVKNLDKPISTSEYDSEAKKMLAICNVSAFDIESLTKDYETTTSQMQSITHMLKSLTDDDYNIVFASKILYYSMSNYLLTHTSGLMTDMDLVIPNMVKNPLSDEVISEVITKEELKNTFRATSSIIPAEGEMGDIMDEFRRVEEDNKLDDVLASEIIHFTVSKYLKDNVDIISSSVSLIIPNKSQEVFTDEVVDKVIKASEIKNLIHGALKIIPKGKEVGNVLDELEKQTEDDYNEIFNSDILHFTFSNYLENEKDDFLGDGGDLIVPLAAKDILSDEVLVDVIKKNELTMFLKDSTSILPEDKDNIKIGIIMNSLIKNDQLLRGLILSASMTNMLCNSASVKDNIEDVLKIPQELKDEATVEELQNFNYNSNWYRENKSFMKSVDALIGVDLDDEHTVLDSDLSDKVYGNFKDLNKGTPTKLELAYDSFIMANTITSRINELDFMNDEKKNSIKDTFSISDVTLTLSNIYKEAEIESLVDLINFLELDLKSTSVKESALNKTKLQKFNEPAADFEYSGTYLNYFYQHDITGLILTNGIEDCLDVPQDAYLSGKLYVTEGESSALIEALDTLNLDLNSFTFDSNVITITDVKGCIYNSDTTVKSKILLQKTSDEIIDKVTSLIIMAADYDSTYLRIKAKALYDFFNAAEVMGVVHVSQDPNIENFAMNKDDVAFDTMAESGIMRSSLVQYISISYNSISVDPILINDTNNVVTGSDINSINRAQLSKNEAYNLFRSIKILSGGTGKVSNISLDLATISGLSDENKDVVLSTELIRYRISEAIKPFYMGTIDLYNTINVKTLGTASNVGVLTKEQIIDYITP